MFEEEELMLANSTSSESGLVLMAEAPMLMLWSELEWNLTVQMRPLYLL